MKTKNKTDTSVYRTKNKQIHKKGAYFSKIWTKLEYHFSKKEQTENPGKFIKKIYFSQISCRFKFTKEENLDAKMWLSIKIWS